MATRKSSGTGRSSGGRARSGNSSSRARDKGLTGTARDNKLATAAAVGGAVAAGVFLWSRRNQIGEQIGKLGREIGGNAQSESESSADGDLGENSEPSGDGRSQSEIAEEALTLKEIGAAA